MLAEILPKIAAELREPDHDYYPRPSIAGPDRCLRSLVYWANGTPRAPLPGRAVMVFDDSSWHEELTADWLRRTAFKLHSQQMAVETPVGKGHIDGIVTDLLGVDRLYEHKALNHFSFERIWNGEPPRDYLTQCALYMHGLQRINPELAEGLLLVKSKNTSAYLETRFRYAMATDELELLEMVRSDGRVKQMGGLYPRITTSAVDRFAVVGKFVEDGTLPMRPYDFGTDYPCGYCSWERTCWEGYEDEFRQRGEAPVADDKALEEMGVEYVSNARAAKVLDQRQEALKSRIKGRLAELNARSAVCPGVRMAVDLRKFTTIDKSRLPDAALREAQVEKFSEVLNVREVRHD